MSNFKIIQDVPDQARIKIFGSQNVALSTDASGVLGISAAQVLGISASVVQGITAPQVLGVSGSVVQGITAPQVLGVSGSVVQGITAAQVLGVSAPEVLGVSGSVVQAITAPQVLGVSGSVVQAITAPEVLGVSGTMTTTLATSDVTIVSQAIPTAGGPSTAFTVLNIPNYTFGLYSDSGTSADQIVCQLQISADGANYENDGAVVTLSNGVVGHLVPGVFMKYSRVYYSATGNATTTLQLIFQAHD